MIFEADEGEGAGMDMRDVAGQGEGVGIAVLESVAGGKAGRLGN